jgi:hypothetical protein
MTWTDAARQASIDARTVRDEILYLPTLDEIRQAREVLINRMLECEFYPHWGICYAFSQQEQYKVPRGRDRRDDPYVWVPKMLRALGYKPEPGECDYFWPLNERGFHERINALDFAAVVILQVLTRQHEQENFKSVFDYVQGIV